MKRSFNLGDGLQAPFRTRPVAAPPGQQRRRDETRAAILRAARDRLVEVGYANLNVRDIASDAGVNHALIGYHFRGKQQLVMAVLDEANRRLLERQTRMYQGTAQRRAEMAAGLRLLRRRPASGFVRLLMELMGASFHDEELRREFVPRPRPGTSWSRPR